MQKARDSAVERADELQTQLNEMHTDLEKLRKSQMSELYERVCLFANNCMHYYSISDKFVLPVYNDVAVYTCYVFLADGFH